MSGIFRKDKTNVGQHEFAKPFCATYCNKNRLHCPLTKLHEQGRELPSIERWIDKQTGNIYDLESKYDGEIIKDGNEYEQEKFYSCYCDGSGFEYDLMQTNVIGPNSAMESIYDFFQYGIETEPLKYSTWNSWLDKFQYDYRFGRVSDQNATTVMFPNVDNPWMMTEYVFQGTGKMADIRGTEQTGNRQVDIYDETEIVIQPPLYNPDTLTLINGDVEISNSNAFDEKYKGLDCDSNSYYKQFRKLENWDKFNGNFNGGINRQNQSNWSGIDAGVKLYKANVNVQCVKWGEHGNIPPHTINMTAPKDYLDPTKSVARIKPKYTMHIGAPIYANTHGILGWADRFAYVIPDQTFEQDSNSEIKRYKYQTYEYQQFKDNGVNQGCPVHPHNQLMGMQPTEYLIKTNEYVHGGCKYLKGENGVLKCLALQSEVLSDQSYFNPDYCSNFNGYGDDAHKCPNYISSEEYPVIATYEHQATNMAEYYAKAGYLPGNDAAQADKANRVLNMSTGLPLADAFTAMGGYSAGRLIKEDQYTPQDYETWYTLDFQVENGAFEQPQTTGDSGNYGRGVQIVPGTGKYALNTRENAKVFGGDDTNVYGDISTLNFHRFFASIMHCATQANCNQVCGLTQSWGYKLGQRAGGDGKCRYYKDKINGGPGCPTSCVPKRAVEFGYAMRYASPFVFSIMQTYNTHVANGMLLLNEEQSNSSFIKGMERNVLQYVKRWGNEYIKIGNYYLRRPQAVFNVANSTLELDKRIIVETSNSGQEYYGNEYKKVADGHYILCYLKLENIIYTNKIQLFNPITKEFEIKSNSYSLAQSAYFYYKPLTDSGNTLSPTSYHHVDEDGLWLCKADLSYIMPTYNCLMVDNDKKFIGGYHPQYKDYGQRGQQFMQDVEDPNDEWERENNATGDRVYNSVPVVVNKKGYWIDESGLWIIDERTTGTNEPVVTDSKRAEPSGPGTCISIKKSNTSMDMTTGKSEQAKTVNAAVFSNDPYYLVCEVFSESRTYNQDKQKFQGRPMLQGQDETYYAPVIIKDDRLLPTMRQALWCPHCDYYIAFKYYNDFDIKCPWCGTEFEIITGDTGDGMNPGDTWDSNASVIKKFFKLNAIGQVQVWGPPGTCVHTDAYFWKNQNHISNGFKRQIYHRLGNSNKDNGGGGWAFDKMSPESEFTLGYPQSLGTYVSIPNEISKSNSDSKNYRYFGLKWDSDIEKNGELGKYAMWNDIAPQHYIPSFYDSNSSNSQEDDGLISPYSLDVAKGLKMISFDQMRVLRNALQPMFAYCSQPLTPYEYPTLRASFDKREEKDQLIVYQGKRATVDPVVLATAGPGGDDAYVEYNSGDLAVGNVREFYPNGYTWWFMKQMIGGRYSTFKGGEYHMDDGTNGSGMASWPNTRKTVAKCALFLYGMLPLDKEILKAYVQIPPGNTKNAYKKPVGRKWTGGPSLCWHWHPRTVQHAIRDAHGNAQKVVYGGDGFEAHLHGNAGYGGKVWFDDDGLYYQNYEKDKKQGKPGMEYIPSQTLFDESNYQGWGISNYRPDETWQGWYESNINKITGLPIMDDKTFFSNVGTNKVAITTSNSSIVGYAYDSSIDNGWEKHNITSTTKTDIKYQYIYLDSNSDIHQNFTEEKIWKTNEKDTIQKTINNNSYNAQFMVSDGEDEISYTFRETEQDLYQNYIPQQQQDIPGYFDMSWTHSSNHLQGTYDVQENRTGVIIGDETILQDETSSNKGSYSGTTLSVPSGKQSRYIDVTDIVKKMYNERVERQFSCQAGNTVEEVLSSTYKSPDLQGTLKKVDKDISEVIEARNNNNLMDKVAYPQTEDDGSIIPVSSDGDCYELASKNIEIYCNVPILPLRISSNSKTYQVKFIYKDRSNSSSDSYGFITSNVFTSMTQIEDELKSIFPGGEIQPQSNHWTKIVYKQGSNKDLQSIIVEHTPFNIDTKEYTFEQNRIVEVSSYLKGFHPQNLYCNNRGWKFNDYTPQIKSFVVDLASAPICLKQKDFRYREGSKNYSSCYCPNENCLAHKMTASVAANQKDIRFNASSNKCPICGEQLDDENIVAIPGDGIMTYTYDRMFHPDPIIQSIKVKPFSFLGITQVTTVSARYDGSDFWKTLLYCSNSNTHTWTGSNSDIERARYVKVECLVTPVDVLEEFEVATSNSNPIKDWEIIVRGDFADMNGFDLRGQGISYDTGSTSTVVSAIILKGQKQMSISVKDKLNRSISKVYVQMKKYQGGIQSLQINGKHYKTSSNGHEDKNRDKFLTITGHEDIQSWQASFSQSSYAPTNVPTQIKYVQIGKSNGGGIKLTQVQKMDDLKWTTVETTITDKNGNTSKIKRITNGTYYYDVQKGNIKIPVYNQSNSHWSTFEKSNSTLISFLPNTLSMGYWSGNGTPIALQASANGNGPSYQLEKGAIQFIRQGNFQSNGVTCKMIDISGNIKNKIDIPWACFNSKPSGLSLADQSRTSYTAGYLGEHKSGKFQIGNFTGSEIAGTDYQDDASFISLFGKQGSNLRGHCTTQMTFVGAPNKVISGNIKVYAKDKTVKKVKTDGNTEVTISERTGGIKNGVLVVKVMPDVSAEDSDVYRMTVTYGLPKLYIYAKERKLTDEI